MEGKVKVTATEGEVVIVSENNPDYGYIRVTQERAIADENGWIRVRQLSALVLGRTDDLRKLGWFEGQFIPGKIVIREQLTPFNKKNPDKDLKVAGDTGIVCKVDDKPIYRNTFWVDNAAAVDTTLQHTNGEEIRAAYGVATEDGATVDEFSEDDDLSMHAVPPRATAKENPFSL